MAHKNSPRYYVVMQNRSGEEEKSNGVASAKNKLFNRSEHKRQ